MIYQRQTKKKNRKPIVFIAIFILILILGFANIIFPKKFIEGIGYPILKVRQVAFSPFSDLSDYFKSKTSLIREKEALQDELNSAKLKNLEYKILEVENDQLRNLVNRNVDEVDLVAAQVLVRPPQSMYDTFVVDVGEDKISVGNHIYSEGVFIGTVKEVFNNTSIVQLISSSGIKTNVKIRGEVDVEAIGRGGGRMVAILPKDIEINKGDPVSLPGFDSGIIGVVEEAESSDANSFQRIHFNIPISLSEIDIVEVRR